MEKVSNLIVSIICRHYLKGQFNLTALAKELKLSRTTVRKYCAEFREIEKLYPHKVRQMNFRLPSAPRIRTETPLHAELIAALPALIDQTKTKKLYLIPLWNDYRAIYPTGYGLTWFTHHFIAWRRANDICLFLHRRVNFISNEDRAILNKWRNSADRDNWKRAVVILGSEARRKVEQMAEQVETRVVTVLKWIDNYKERGISGLIDAPYRTNQDILAAAKLRQDRIIKIAHETPAIHGFNRTSWKLVDLAKAYEKIYGESVCDTSVGVYLKNAGFGFKKSREVLTSPDPLFREKLAHIKTILSGLQETERFFSIDEFGPFAIKIKGGRTFVKDGIPAVVPQHQKSKGWLICTAALELSTNQVTHFYSLKKNTEEMIKLLDVLIVQYHDATRLYLSWDAATWHISNRLNERIALLNDPVYRGKHHTPVIELAPLPASAQFLNVIESVFSGLAKSVIHNSDYQSVDECKLAIDRHFENRNAHFIENPKRAGHKIWGNEVVKPVFDDANNCKKPPGRVTIKP